MGQLGNNSNINSSVPVNVVLNKETLAIAADDGHTCALIRGGSVKCWGHNNHGQLGNNWNGDSWTPVDVVGLSSGVEAITVGLDYTCALTSDWTAKCWGVNDYGELGDNTNTERWTPVDVVWP